MSVRLMGAVFELDIPATEKLVLLAMADHARDDGTGCYPSIELLARKTSQSRRGVQKITRRLEQAGLIVPSKVSRGRRSTEYNITILNREPGSLFTSAQPRTAGRPTANASASNREPECAQPRTGFARTVKNHQEPSGNHAAAQRGVPPQPFRKGGANANSNRNLSFDERRSQENAADITSVLRRLETHLAIFGEHYRQRITELSVIAYAEDLAGLTPEQLDAACQRARRTSEFMPVSAAILKAHEELNRSRREEFLGVPMIEYPPITQAERDEALKFSEELKKKLGAPPAKPEKKPVFVRPSLLSLDEQKKVLREKGFLR